LRRIFVTAACAATLCACSPHKATAPAAPAAPAPKYNIDLPMDELMGHVVDPASFVYWSGSGTEETAKGTRSLAPTTEEGWERLENGAAVLIEAGNLLQLPGRPRAPIADWDRYAQQLTATAVQAKAAAEKHDEKGVYDVGARIYQVCTACHEEYVIQPGLKANGRPQGTLPDWPADVKAKQEQYQEKH
jgi:hypothetical protein